MRRLPVGNGGSAGGSALLLPPQSAAAGHLVLSRAPLTLTPEGESHLLCIQLTGQAGGAVPCRADGAAVPGPGRDLPRRRRAAGPPCRRGRYTPQPAASQLAFALLCELAGADSAAPPLPPLVEAAIEDIRQNYAGLVRRGGAQ